MLFSEILGQEHIKNHLIKSASLGRIPHAQLFVGPEGSGTLAMAIAYAQFIICQNSGNDNIGSNTSCNIKFNNFQHPDLHFVFPTVKSDSQKKNNSNVHMPFWRNFLAENIYGSLFDWYKEIGAGNKQGMIRVDEASDILKSLALKSHEGGYKVMIIWMADKMNTDTANKLLKLIEEPTDKTVLILITENEDDILQTVRSRCQALHFNSLPEEVISKALVLNKNIDEKLALNIAHQSQGNYNKALHLLQDDNEELPFEKWFVDWVRSAYRAVDKNPEKGKAAVLDLIQWSENIAGVGREAQKQFLSYCINMFRQAMLINYQAEKLVYLQTSVDGFKLEKLAPFVTGNNINDIFKELSDASYHIERNGNAKIVLTDLSIKLTRLIHNK